MTIGTKDSPFFSPPCKFRLMCFCGKSMNFKKLTNHSRVGKLREKAEMQVESFVSEGKSLSLHQNTRYDSFCLLKC